MHRMSKDSVDYCWDLITKAVRTDDIIVVKVGRNEFFAKNRQSVLTAAMQQDRIVFGFNRISTFCSFHTWY